MKSASDDDALDLLVRATLLLRSAFECFAADVDIYCDYDEYENLSCRVSAPSKETDHELQIGVVPASLFAVTQMLAECILDSDLFYDHTEPWPLCRERCGLTHSLEMRHNSDEAYWACSNLRRRVTRAGDLRRYHSVERHLDASAEDVDDDS